MKELFEDIFNDNLTPILMPDGKLKAYSDKNTEHCYVEHLYENLFKDIRYSATKILEIGIYGGGSMLLWWHYFSNAHIYGIDISYYKGEFAFDNRITQIIGNAYSQDLVDMLADNSFDVVIDDGPHNLDSFTFFVKNYWSKVKPGGYFIIEDIYDPGIVPGLLARFPSNEASSMELCDFRHVKGLYDDVVLVIKKKD